MRGRKFLCSDALPHTREASTNMPHIVGATQRVVEHGGITIDEMCGNASTNEDRISIALVKVAEPSSEPWLTLHYDEWMCVLKGRMVLLHGDGKELEVKAGETVFIAKGERFRPTFPEAGTEYVPVCLPAFKPERCIREEEEGSAVSKRLAELHSNKKPRTDAPPSSDAPSAPGAEVLYHMCQVRSLSDFRKRPHQRWISAVPLEDSRFVLVRPLLVCVPGVTVGGGEAHGRRVLPADVRG